MKQLEYYKEETQKKKKKTGATSFYMKGLLTY